MKKRGNSEKHLEMTITEKEQQITQQSIIEANTIYYVYGTRKELMSKELWIEKVDF